MPEDTKPNDGEVSDVMSQDEHEHDYDDSDLHAKDDDEDETMTDVHIKSEGHDNGEAKKKYDPKDPLRPRRKKARRACYACQRAHLTCGMSASFLQVPSHTPPLQVIPSCGTHQIQVRWEPCEILRPT